MLASAPPDPSPPTVAPVEVWAIDGLLPGHAEVLQGRLTVSERDRAARLRCVDARTQHIVGRAMVRTLVGARLGLRPVEVPLAVDGDGRPLVDVPGAPDISVAHTAGMALVALHPRGRIGIDVERADRRVSSEVIRRCCTPAELRWLDRQDPAHRGGAFLRLWVRKEALAKADGRGLAVALHHLDARGPTPKVPGAAAGARWWVRDLPLEDGYLGAVTGPSHPASVRVRHRSLPGPLAGAGHTADGMCDPLDPFDHGEAA